MPPTWWSTPSWWPTASSASRSWWGERTSSRGRTVASGGECILSSRGPSSSRSRRGPRSPRSACGGGDDLRPLVDAREFRGDGGRDRLYRDEVDLALRHVPSLLGQAAPVEGSRGLGIDTERGIVVGDGAIGLAELEVDESSRLESLWRAGLQAERFVAVRERGRQPPGERAGHAASRPRRRVPRFQPDELVEIANGPLVLSGDGEDEPPILEGQRIAWVEPDRLIEVLEGPLQVTLAAMGVPAIVEGRRIARIEPDGLVVVLNRPVQLAPAGIRVAPIAEGEGHGGVEPDGPVVVLDRSPRLGLPTVRGAAVIVGERVLRIEADGLVVVVDRAIVPALDAVGRRAVVEGCGEMLRGLARRLDHERAALDHELDRHVVLARAPAPVLRELGAGRRRKRRHGGENRDRSPQTRSTPERHHRLRTRSYRGCRREISLSVSHMRRAENISLAQLPCHGAQGRESRHLTGVVIPSFPKTESMPTLDPGRQTLSPSGCSGPRAVLDGCGWRGDSGKGRSSHEARADQCDSHRLRQPSADFRRERHHLGRTHHGGSRREPRA